MPTRPGVVPPARQPAIIFTTAQQLRQEPGPSTDERYAFVLELGAMFAWTPYNTSTDDGINVIAPTSGPGTGRWRRTRSDDRGADLVDGDATILVSGNRTRILPAATLTANSVLTLGTAGAVAGDELFIVRNGVEAFSYSIANGGPLADTLAVMPPSVRAWCRARFDGTDWIHLASGLSLATS